MRTRTARGSFLDPRTKILIWLLANVVVFTWAPAVFRIAVMLAYFGLFLLERKGKTLAVTLRFLPALRQDFRHIRDAMALRRIHGLEEKLECVYVPMLMGAAQTAEELSESATARGIEHPGKMSSWRPIGFHVQDAAMTLLFLALCVGGICCKGVLP